MSQKTKAAIPATLRSLSQAVDTAHDPETAYYRSLTDLARLARPSLAVELGTFRGHSAAAILDGLGPDARLLSVDIRPRKLPSRVTDDPRFTQVVGDSRHLGCFESPPDGTGLLFVDTEHNYGQARAEWELYRPLLKPGALVCFDDVHLNEDMARFWNELDVVKWDTGRAFHHSGFGVAVNEKQPQHLDRPGKPKLAACVLVHDDTEWMEPSLRSVSAFGDVFVFVNDRPWSGTSRDTSRAKKVASDLGATVVTGSWLSEEDHRQKAHRHLRSLGYTHALLADTDEVYEPGLVAELKAVAEMALADRVHVEWDTYWSDPQHVVRPREPFRPCVLVDLFRAFPVRMRDFAGGRGLLLDASHGIVHHLSYCGSDERVRTKVSGWSHKDEVVTNWWHEKWEGWKADPTVQDLHPTNPQSYGFVEHIGLPPALVELGVDSDASGTVEDEPPAPWPRVSVCIPLYGGPEDIERCLASLERCRCLVHEAIVVDNAFPDGAKDVVKKHEWIRLIENDENVGFARASNQAYQASTGDVVLFLNSDTILTFAGLNALVEDLMQSGTVAAAGPVSNRVGHSQQIPVTYTSLENLDIFAEDLAATGRHARDTDMLVGFCLAVKRDVLDETGGFDEGFGTGLFEDNDLCYRMRRAGYRLVVSERAFVHHQGSASLARSGVDTGALLAQNQALFEAKWRADVESGFASHLSGLDPRPVCFEVSRKPETLMEDVRAKAAKADVSLCMIVRDEERVIGACLESARPYFTEMIVVDTGSSDRTVEIAESLGAKVYVHPWEDSFSVARNHSLSYASGKWVFWMDADDTLPFATGEAIVNAALSAPPAVHAFVVPVQFVDEGPASGTRVDHVKLFRNFRDLRFEGRIHEQILHSISAHAGAVANLGQVVLHSGYDTSVAGQAKKRCRDRHLLRLDYFERPDHPFVLFNLGMTCHFLGEHKKAERWLRRSIARATDRESHLRKAYDLLGGSLREQGREQEALEVFAEGLERVGDDAELHFHAAILCSQSGDDEAAIEHYNAVLAYDPTGAFHSIDIGILGFKTLHNRATVFAQLRRYEEAKADFLAAIAGNPRFLPSAFGLFALAVERRDFATTRACIDAVAAQLGLGRDAVDLIVQEAIAARGRESVAAVLTSLARTNPGAAELRLRLARELAETGRIGEAIPMLEELKGQGFAEAAFIMGVNAVLRNDYPRARNEMLDALSLNPDHQQTVEQLTAINRAMGLPEEAGVVQ